MKIIIIGDGKLGFALAETLSRENHDITIVDNNAEALRRALKKLDVLCKEGSGSSMDTLLDAGAQNADLFIAVTSQDEVNMICCLMAHKLGAKYIIARIRNAEYHLTSSAMDSLSQNLGIDLVINPEMSTAHDISRLLRFPEAGSISQFCRGRVELVELSLKPDMRILNTPLQKLTPKLPVKVLFCAIIRNDEIIIPDGNTSLHEGDTVYVAGEPRLLTQFVRYIGMSEHKVKNVMIVGGSRIAYYLARELAESNIAVTLVEENPERCAKLDAMLQDAVLVNGDGTDMDLLLEERLPEMDAFVALTNRDEYNLVTAMRVKQTGLYKVVAKVTRGDYSDVRKVMKLDSIVSPKEIAANRIIQYVRAMENSRGSFVERLHRLLEGRVEAMEFIATYNSRLINIPLRELSLRKGVLILAIVHKEKTIIPDGNSYIREGNRVIVMTTGGQLFSDLDDILGR